MVSNEYADDHIARCISERERELFHYDFDRQMFMDIVQSTDNEELRIDLTRRIGEIERQSATVREVLDALKRRVRSPEAHAAALVRLST